MFWYVIFSFVLISFSSYKLSHAIKYYAKFAFYMLITAIVSILPYLCLLIYRVKDYRIGLSLAWGYQWNSRLVGVTHEVRGIENIDKSEGGVVIVAPHQSILDLSIIGYLWPLFRCTIVVKKILFYALHFGVAVWLSDGVLFIDRKNRKAAVNELHNQLDAIQNQLKRIIIFPEGTRSQENKLLPFKKGAFHLAVDSQSMIQPVVVSKYHFLSSKQTYFENGRIILSILPAISCKGLTKDDIPTLLHNTKLLMDAHFEELSRETKP